MDADQEDWQRKVSGASDEELTTLRQADSLGLSRAPNTTFNAIVDTVEEEMQRRGLPRKAR